MDSSALWILFLGVRAVAAFRINRPISISVLYSPHPISGWAVNKFRRILVVAVLALCGCGLPYIQIRERLSPLQGQPLSAATAKLGAPTEETVIFGKKVRVEEAARRRRRRR